MLDMYHHCKKAHGWFGIATSRFEKQNGGDA